MNLNKSNLFINSLTRAILLLFFLNFTITSCNFNEPEFSDGLGPLPQEVDYNLHVSKILSESCFTCHGPDAMAREADLRLDTEEGAFAPLEVSEGSYAIVKGKPEESELYKRITSEDPDYKMPTPDANVSLSKRDIAILKRWIEQGAEYKPHWSLITPKKAELPYVKNRDWPASPIDYFVLKKLEENELEPSPEADREYLLRRISFDLTGLPPTIEELERFLKDDSPDAYEKVVNRLLASEAYGERMATEWLDVARYADAHGYNGDGANEMWPWKEWVISAFNQNMPFDQFTTWQLAGDLLPEATRKQKLATGFNRVHMQNQEGGTIDEEYRVEYVADRVHTTATTFLGMTLQCARCHDHKYDPISTKEYYQFSAFFDNIDEAGQAPFAEGEIPGPTIFLPDEETEKIMTYLEDQIVEQEQIIENLRSNKTDEFLRWREQGNNTVVQRPEEKGLIANLNLNDIQTNQEDSVVTIGAAGEEAGLGRISGILNQVEGVSDRALEFNHGNFINLGKNTAKFKRSEPFSFSFWINPSGTFKEVPVLTKSGAKYIAYRGYDVSLFDNQVSLRLINGWPYNVIHAISQDTLTLNQWSNVTITYDGSSDAKGVEMYINGEKQHLRIEKNTLTKTILTDYNSDFKNQDFLIGHRNSFEELSYQGLRLDEIKIFDRQLSGAEAFVLANHDEKSKMHLMSPEVMSEIQHNILYDHFLLQIDQEFKENAEKLRALRVELNSSTDTLRQVMVMREQDNPRQTYVLERGMYDQLGEKVSPGVPKSILEFPDDLPQNRLGLAQWILSDEHPLTSRVIVNRYWLMLFGEGLVDTPEDLGNQGSLPSHPELLDWLAVDFRESGWNVKELLKQIVMSQTYRQSSKATPTLRERDPQNRLLARGPSNPLTAEMVRDNALVASGLFADKVGGPSVFPYQPEGLWKEKSAGRHLSEYIPDTGESLYRRSLYTFWKRTSPPPGMTTFDAAMRYHSEAKRGQTSTPLQALHTLNDPIYVEASRLLAERMMKEAGETLEEQIYFAFRAANSQRPDERQVNLLIDLYEDELQIYQENPDQAEKLLNVGEHPADPELKSPELAARTLIASVIFNLDESLTKR